MNTKMTASYRCRSSTDPHSNSNTSSNHRPILCYFCLVVLLSIIVRLPSCHAKVSYCPLKNTIVQVQFVDGKFIRFTDDTTNTVDGVGGGAGRTRRLRNLRGDEERHLDLDNTNNTDTTNTTNTTTTKSTSTIYNAKECPCATTTTTINKTPLYCLLTSDNENLCEFDEDTTNGHPNTICTNATIYNHIIRNSWPIVVFSYAVVIVYVLFTEGGRGTIRYVVDGVFCRRDLVNGRLVEMVMESEDRERRRMVELERMVGRRDVTFVLKTTHYYRKGNNHGVDDGDGDGSKEIRTLSPTASTVPSTTGSTPTTTNQRIGSTMEDTTTTKLHTEHESRASLFPIPIATTSTSTVLPMIPPLCHPCFQPPNQTTNTTNNNNNNINNLQTTATTTTTINNHTIDSDDSDNDEDGETCTICILSIKDGDHIGALQCEHIFHVNCLIEWIKRRNVCPLCQSPNIADERRPPPPSIDDATVAYATTTHNGTDNDNTIVHSLINSTRWNSEGTRILGRVSSPPTHPTVARFRRLLEERRGVVSPIRHFPGSATRLYPGNGSIRVDDDGGGGGGEGRRVSTTIPPDSITGEPRVTTTISLSGIGGGGLGSSGDSGNIIIAGGGGSNGTDDWLNGQERFVGSGDGRSGSIIRVSTNQRSGGSNRSRRRLMDRRRRLRRMEDMSPPPFGL